MLAGISDSKVREDGTCGKGIFKTFERVRTCNPLTYTTYDEAIYHPEDFMRECRDYYHIENKELEEKFIEATKFMMSKSVFLMAQDYDVVIFEGSQGLLLDMDNGFFPNVTPSRVGLNGVPKPFLKDAEVFLVSRTYLTRHGNGYVPKYNHELDLSNEHETNVYNEFQGEFKTGAIEVSLLNRAYERHCLDNYARRYNCKFNLVLTHMDTVVNSRRFVCEDRFKTYGCTDPKLIASAITSRLIYTPNRVFYNDSIESNIKEI